MTKWLSILVLLLGGHSVFAASDYGAVMAVDVGARQLVVGGVTYQVSPSVKVSLLGSENSVFTLLTTNMVVEVEYYLDEEAGRRVATEIVQLRKARQDVIR